MTWAEPSATLPERAIIKAILHPAWTRIGGAFTLRAAAAAAAALRPLRLDGLVCLAANTYNYYVPHAPDAMYANEAAFSRR